MILMSIIVIATSILYASQIVNAAQYEFTIRYAKTNPDGYFRTVIGVEDQNGWHFPGPTINVTEGEMVTILIHTV